MMKSTTLPLLALALTLGACSKDADPTGNSTAPVNAAAAVAAPAGAAWTETASKTEAGGFLLGNPAAKVKLIEYGALSCSHCADFTAKSSEPMKALISKGTLSYEFRPFLLNVLDMPAFLLARCNGPLPFFPISEQIFAAQPEWMAHAQQITPAEQQSWAGMKPEQISPRVAAILQLDTFVAQRGLAADKAKTCLTDAAAIKELETIRDAGIKEFEITGTPTLIVNGKRAEVGTWKDLEPILRAQGV